MIHDNSIKYRIKSWQQELEDILFVVEESGEPGELRLAAATILANPTILKGFSKQDAAQIRFAAEQ